MKFFKKFIISVIVLSILSLARKNAFSNNLKPLCKGIHHLNNHSISGKGYENIYVNISCPNNSDTHNRAKIHFYNRSSEPVTVRAEGEAITVEPWSGNSLTLKVSQGSLPITVRGLNDNSNQILKGELSVKSWAE
ncbi:MAG: hypothetical protein K2F59_03510 [Eubacteriales bacterium]|nr:hypothetical protein [Eubacteriales bacterium]